MKSLQVEDLPNSAKRKRKNTQESVLDVVAGVGFVLNGVAIVAQEKRLDKDKINKEE